MLNNAIVDVGQLQLKYGCHQQRGPYPICYVCGERVDYKGEDHISVKFNSLATKTRTKFVRNPITFHEKCLRKFCIASLHGLQKANGAG